MLPIPHIHAKDFGKICRVPAVLVLTLCAFGQNATRQTTSQTLSDILHSEHEHDSQEWVDIARRLPDPATASSARLEMTADVLRARRYDADALGFYNAALDRGADQHVILKKMGVTCLQMQQSTLARMLFARAVHLDKRDAVAWNDMAAADLALGDARAAVGEYRRAVKIDNRNAVFHANLALAYFQVQSPERARQELEKALRLDPEILHHNNESGFNAQILSSEHYGDICLQMAHLYAQQGDEPILPEWLGKAGERGINLHTAMARDPVLRPWLHDERVLVLMQNHQRLSAGTKAPGNVPSLGTATLSR